MTRIAVGLLLVLCLAASACKGDADASKNVDHSAHAIGDHSCASCGMVVREQSAPRGQVVHRDGTREYFCSVSDMITYLQAPSRHGRAVSTHVETMDPAADPKTFDIAQRPWVAAEKASYVLGVDKPRVMGTPILVYATTQQAQVAAKSHRGHVVDWSQLKAKLSHK